MKLLLASIAIAGSLVSTPSLANRCTAHAEFIDSYPANSDQSAYKFKFHVTSSDCEKYSCRGYIHYRIHFAFKSDGNSSGKTTLISYAIPEGQDTIEVTDRTYPASTPVEIQDVELNEVTCSSP